VAAALRVLFDEMLDRSTQPPAADEAGCWEQLVELVGWRIGWHERVRDQWSRLGSWALSTDQPEAVIRAIMTAEWAASTDALAAEAELVRVSRRAAKAVVRSRVVA
jgi:hypothetical protein